MITATSSARHRFGTLAALLLGWGLAGPTPASAADQALVLTPCRLPQFDQLVSIEAECGMLRVAEDPARPEGRQIELFVARVPAISRRKQPDPLFLLAGGPGMGAAQWYPNVAGAFARIRRDREIVLVDQRGTGRSAPLQCAFDDEELLETAPDAIAQEARRCVDGLQPQHDLRFYTTSVAVRDLDRVRAALGYERVNLYGGSYGTRVAQHYARRFPERTRSLVLDGVVPPALALGPDIALDAQAALDRIFARCRAEASCSSRFDPARDYATLRDSLRRAPVPVSLADPRSGEPVRLDFGWPHLVVVLRLGSYTTQQAALLPMSLSLAAREQFYVPLAAQFLVATRGLEDALAYGMHNSVVCTEDLPFVQRERLDRARMEATYIGTAQLDVLSALCSGWPRGMLDEDFHAPISGAARRVPALLLSGTADPVTPARYGDEAAKGFDDAAHLVMAEQGHGLLAAPCVERIIGEFLAAATARGLDLECAKQARPTAFFTSLAGPGP